MSTTFRLAAFASLALSSALPASANAEQFVLFDATFTFTKQDADASSSHYFVRDLNPAQPEDWTGPVDYRNGTVHVRTEVIEKPAGGEVTQWTLCYIPHQGFGQSYGCTGSGTYTEEGVYERDESMTSWWENQSIDWTKGIKEMHLVMKDANGSDGHVHYRNDPEKFLPTKMRITMIQVSAGSTYDPSKVPGLSGDTPDAGSDAGFPADPAVDAGTGSDDVTGDGTVGDGSDGAANPDDGTTHPGDDTGDWSSDETSGDGSGTPSGDGAGTPPTSDTSSSGCAVTAREDSAANLWALALGFGLVLARRRRARARH